MDPRNMNAAREGEVCRLGACFTLIVVAPIV